MAKATRLNAKRAARRFADVFKKAGVTQKTPDILRGWAAFIEFCEVPIERTTEGFIFHAGFKVDFPPPDHERVLDYSAYKIGFTRYWYKKDVEGDFTAYVAECGFEIADDPVLRGHEWVDIEIDAGKADVAQQPRLEKFVEKVEAIADLWEVLRTAKVRGHGVILRTTVAGCHAHARKAWACFGELILHQ